MDIVKIHSFEYMTSLQYKEGRTVSARVVEQ
jgi:hypothetical protein